MKLSTLLHAKLLLATAHAIPKWTGNVQGLFSESMSWMDSYYDSGLGYLYDVGGEAALRHDTRSSAWYALGLLARNKGKDAEEAESIISNVIGGQFSDPSKQWYGTYQKTPEEPEVGSVHYPSEMYGSWDPNWRGFVGITFVLMLEEYAHILSNDTQELIMESLKHATIGDTYRVGGVDGDNLYPSYSNPALMRAFVSGWVGRRLGDKNMTSSGEAYANEIIDLFNKTNTLSEFNSGTYTGVSLLALVLWCEYLPKDSVMSKTGPTMYRATWDAIKQLWHPGFKNMAGPWDRTYGYDMNRYLSVMALWFWAYLDKDSSSLIDQPKIMSHSADFALAPLVATVAHAGASLLPDDFFEDFKCINKARVFEAQAWSPPFDKKMRNITTWLSTNLTVGGVSFDQTQLGGPSADPESFTPAVVQWRWHDEVGFLALRPTETALQTEVSANRLSLTYSNGDGDSQFIFKVSTFRRRPTIRNLHDIPGLGIKVSGNVDEDYATEFHGANGGEGDVTHGFEYWQYTFSMPKDFEGSPKLVLEFDTL